MDDLGMLGGSGRVSASLFSVAGCSGHILSSNVVDAAVKLLAASLALGRSHQPGMFGPKGLCPA